MSEELSKYQSAIIDFHENDDEEHGIAQAYAGSGKTFILRRCAEVIDDEETMFIGAFNKAIADELTKKIRRANTEISTLHSLGGRTLRKVWRKKAYPTDDFDVLGRHIDDVLGKTFPADAPGDVRKLVEKCMAFVADDNPDKAFERVEDLMYRFECAPSDPQACSPEKYVNWALKTLAKLREPSDHICFGQMLYVPAFHKMKTGWFKRVFIDETQDMNRAQLTLARHALHDYGRFFAVGDRKQAIYGWNGADASGMDKMKSLFKAKEFKLPISYRAPEAVAKLVRDSYIPDFEARPGAPDGLVKLVDVAFMRKHWAPGDMFISRKNAPLPKVCLMALTDGIPAYIKGGRDVTKHLFGLIKKSRQSGTAEFLKWLSQHVERQLLLLSNAKQEKAIDDLLDTKATLVALAEDTDAVSEIEARLNKLFADDTPGGKLMCATAFKAKGLETEPGRAVWLDWPSFRDNSPEECNIRYVAETRTQHALYMVVNKLGGGS